MLSIDPEDEFWFGGNKSLGCACVCVQTHGREIDDLTETGN
jgi:hypothetical protein